MQMTARLRVGMLCSAVACAIVLPMQRALTQPPDASRPMRRELVGVVRDPSGVALPGVTIAIPGQSTVTSGRGSFLLFTAGIDTVTITVRQVGYTPVSALLTAREQQWDTVLVQLERTAQPLAGVTVRETSTRHALGLRDFEERRAKGNGVFVSRAEIAARNAARPSDMLRNMRGVNVVRGRVRFVSQAGPQGALCIPDVWLDGARARGMEVDDILASDIEAMELYSNISTVPFEFSARSVNTPPCGSIVIWTRTPDAKDR